jgi:hypothetical protein
MYRTQHCISYISQKGPINYRGGVGWREYPILHGPDVLLFLHPYRTFPQAESMKMVGRDMQQAWGGNGFNVLVGKQE